MTAFATAARAAASTAAYALLVAVLALALLGTFALLVAPAHGAPKATAGADTGSPRVARHFGDGPTPIPNPLVKDPIFSEPGAVRAALGAWLAVVRVERVRGGLRYVDCYDGQPEAVEALGSHGADLMAAYVVPMRPAFEAALARTQEAESWTDAEVSDAFRGFVLAATPETDGPFLPAALATTCTDLPCCGTGPGQCGDCGSHRCDCGTCLPGRACRCERGGPGGTCAPPASRCNIDDPATLRLRAVGVDGQ